MKHLIILLQTVKGYWLISLLMLQTLQETITPMKDWRYSP